MKYKGEQFIPSGLISTLVAMVVGIFFMLHLPSGDLDMIRHFSRYSRVRSTPLITRSTKAFGYQKTKKQHIYSYWRERVDTRDVWG